MSEPRPATIVISDWLANCQVGQWTPFEAAIALKAALTKEGYEIRLVAKALDAEAEATRWHLAATKPERERVIEECAKVLDECADDWRRIRDPGMANNAASYARKIRALKGDPA